MAGSVRVEEATVENWQQVLQNIKDDCDNDLKNINSIISNTLDGCDGNIANQFGQILENSSKDGKQTVENIGTVNSFLEALLETKRNQ